MSPSTNSFTSGLSPSLAGIPSALPRRDRVTPQSLEAEQSTLGAMLMEKSAISVALEVLSPTGSDFYRNLHQKIFRIIVELSGANLPVDIVTVAEELRRRGQLEECGGGDYLTSLIESCPSSVGVKDYAAIVKDKASLRQMLTFASNIETWVYGAGEEEPENSFRWKSRTNASERESVGITGTDADRVIEKASRFVMQMAGATKKEGLQPVQNSLLSTFQALMERMENKGAVPGISTGLASVDRVLCGLQPGNIIIVGARPKMGKSGFALQVGMSVAGLGLPVAYFSMEMSREELNQRMICNYGRVDAGGMRRGRLDDEEMGRVADSLEAIGTWPFHVDITRNISSSQLCARARALAAARGKMGLIVVDYLQLIESATGARGGNTNQSIFETMRDLSALASELECPVLVLSQLSREVEKREDKRPMMSDLRDSGSIESEAHVVLLLYRAGYYARKARELARQGMAPNAQMPDELPIDDSEAEVIVAAQRSGPTDTVKVKWEGRYIRFDDFTPEELARRSHDYEF